MKNLIKRAREQEKSIAVYPKNAELLGELADEIERLTDMVHRCGVDPATGQLIKFVPQQTTTV